MLVVSNRKGGIAMPLSMGQVGKQYTISACHAKGEVKKRLENLGVLPGEQITLLAQRGGDLIIKIKDARLALNRGMASVIFVK
ncbi:MAG TPA: ferrous iron transport protein A [Clostridiales bacterium]|nr:ferrous iron transport protein A [Clostridiales bacterium]